MTRLCFVVVSIGFLVGGARSVAAQDFGYPCETCPANWQALNEEWFCGVGDMQSPIAISSGRAKFRRLPRLRLDFGVTRISPLTKSTNVEAEVEDGGFSMGTKEFEFVQFHFHTLSEHVIDGEHFPLELHMVHRTDGGELAVLAVLIKQGRELQALNPVIDAWNEVAEMGVDAETTLDSFDLNTLVPRRLTSLRYLGSTTTPPCVEVVRWIILTRPVQLSEDQIGRIRGALFLLNEDFDNNRPVQALNKRRLVTDDFRIRLRRRR